MRSRIRRFIKVWKINMVMMKKLFRHLLRFPRRLLGTEMIAQNQQQLRNQLENQWRYLGEQRQLLLMLKSHLKHSLIDLEKARASTTYKRCAEIVSLLSPMDVKGGAYIRVGRDFDGGYVMLDEFRKGHVDVAYSFGIGNDVSWDEAIARRGIDVYMFDHTIDRLPKDHPRFHFFKFGVTGYEKGNNLKKLSEILKENNHTTCKNLIMKMDVEGYEWDVFHECSSDVMGQFSQIVVELHGLSPEMQDQEYLSMVDVLKKINKTHQSIHVHANTANDPLWIGDCVLPQLLEVTYIRRLDFKDLLVPNTRRFPTDIDQPTFEGRPDLDLGHFSLMENQDINSK